MRALKVLSIDFDYFPLSSADIIKEVYPDGIDLTPLMSELIWRTKYKMFCNELFSIEIDEDALSIVKKVIEYNSANKECKGFVTLSHEDAYYIISDFYEDRKYDCINLTNIDFHHDMFNDNQSVDCGNWIGKLCEEYKVKTKWIANRESRKLYGIEQGTDLYNMISTDINSISGKSYDIIYICRSDAWVPPHLDVYFSLLRDTLIDNIAETYVEEGAKENRII